MKKQFFCSMKWGQIQPLQDPASDYLDKNYMRIVSLHCIACMVAVKYLQIEGTSRHVYLKEDTMLVHGG